MMKPDCVDCGRNSGDKDEAAHQSRSTHWSPRVAPARNDMLTRFVQSHTGFLRREDYYGIPCTNCATSIISNMPKPKERNLWSSFSQLFRSLSYFRCLVFIFNACFSSSSFLLAKTERSILYYSWDGMERKRIRLYEGAVSTNEVLPIFCNALVLWCSSALMF